MTRSLVSACFITARTVSAESPGAAVAATEQLLAAVDIAMIEPTHPLGWENFMSWLSPEWVSTHAAKGSGTVRDRYLRFRVQKTVKVPQVQYIDRIIIVPVPVPGQAPTIQSSRELQVFQSFCNDKNQPFTLYRRRQTEQKTVELPRSQFTGRLIGAISRQVSRVQIHTRLSGTPSCMSKSHRRLWRWMC